jgi:Tfp pilus assembly protein FimT
MLDSKIHKKAQGFSLVELLIVVATMMILAAITVPRVLNVITDINLRYAATNLNGLLQKARMQAIRKNATYMVQPTTLPTGGNGYYVDFPLAAYGSADPVLPLGSHITVSLGSGSGAPNESTYLSNLGFTPNSGTQNPSFNARGLPCVYSSGSCPQNGQGFVYFLTNASATGNSTWASVAVTPSGRVQLWTCDGTSNWVQRN